MALLNWPKQVTGFKLLDGPMESSNKLRKDDVSPSDDRGGSFFNLSLRKVEPQKVQGQVIIEYVLLLVVTVAMATLIMRTMVSRNAEDPGFLIRKWHGLLVEIGKDKPPAPAQN